jgi:hypothetical protein
MHPDHKKVQDFIDWFEKTYGRKPNSDDRKPELIEKYAHDMSISPQAAFFYVYMATRPEWKEGESYIPSKPMNIRAGRAPLKVGDNVRLGAQAAVGDPFGSLGQVVLRAEIHGTVETIEPSVAGTQDKAFQSARSDVVRTRGHASQVPQQKQAGRRWTSLPQPKWPPPQTRVCGEIWLKAYFAKTGVADQRCGPACFPAWPRNRAVQQQDFAKDRAVDPAPQGY